MFAGCFKPGSLFCFRGAVEGASHECPASSAAEPLTTVAAPLASTPLRKARDVSGLDSVDGWSVSMATPACDASADREMKAVRFGYQDNSAADDSVCRGLFQSSVDCDLSPIADSSAASLSLFGTDGSLLECAVQQQPQQQVHKRAISSPSRPPPAKRLRHAGISSVEGGAPPVSHFKAPRLSSSVPHSEEARLRQRLLQRFPAAAGENTGFTTAAGKTVSVSTSSMHRAHSMAQSLEPVDSEPTAAAASDCIIEREAEVNCYDVDTQTVQQFLQDSFSSPTPSATSHNTIRDVDSANHNTHSHLTQCSEAPQKHTSFQTASGKKVDISESALQASRKLLSDCSEAPQKHASFQTASGKKVDISESALQASRKLLSDCSEAPQKHASFQTASGKKVDISESALQASRKLLSDCSEAPQKHASFQTASGKKVDISESALQASRKLLSDCSEAPQKHTSFQTASGKKVDISESALQASRKLLSDSSEAPQKHTSFQTASGKKVDISESALQASRKLLSDSSEAPQKHTSFQTASGKKVDISESALQASRKLLSDCSEAPQKHASFQTASGNDSDLQASRSCHAAHTSSASGATVSAVASSSSSNADNPGKSAVVSTPEGICCDRVLHRPLLPFVTYPASSSKPLVGATCVPVWRRGPLVRAAKRCDGAADCRPGRVVPQTGSLLSARLDQRRGRVPLQTVVGCRLPATGSTRLQLSALGVHPSVAAVSVATAIDFVFQGPYFFSSAVVQRGWLAVGDGAVLRLTESGTAAGVEQFWRAFVLAPGVQSDLISYRWFCNHYKLVVWKLAALEVSYPRVFAGRWLTPDWLMLQLKYRYDREIDRAQRSGIHKICEGDDVSSRTMVLCISKIFHSRLCVPGAASLELCDGWYSLPACVDAPLTLLLQSGRLSVGTKLVVSGARLLGCTGPCHPLDVPQSAMLCISANSSRRARWFSRLGVCFSPCVLSVPLQSVLADGGTVGCTEALVARLYPMLYLEKFADGTQVVRNERSERMVARDSLMHSHQRVEELCTELHKQMEDDSSHSDAGSQVRVSAEYLATLQDGKQIYQTLRRSLDPLAVEATLTAAQRSSLAGFMSSEQSRRSEELQRQALAQVVEHRRTVIPFLSARLEPRSISRGSWRLTLWKPAAAVVELLSEGAVLKLFSLNAHRTGGVELVGTHRSHVEPLPDTCCPAFRARSAVMISQIVCTEFYNNEFDTVGFVAFSVESECGKTAVCFTDGFGAVVAVLLPGGLKGRALEGLVVCGVKLAVSNLTYRGTQQGLPVASAGQCASFSRQPAASHLRAALASTPLMCHMSLLKELEQEHKLLFRNNIM